MIASLASFTGQYPPELIAKGRQLFEEGLIGRSSREEETYTMYVTDGKKNRQVMVRVEEPEVTNIFCTCGPDICPHVIAVFFKLRKQFKIKEEPFSEKILEPAAVDVLGNKINNLIYVSRAINTKDGELEELGRHTSLDDLTPSRLEAKATGNLSGYDHHPIFNGAKRLLGAAIREYGHGNYEAVFAAGKAVLTGICRLGILSNSACECCNAAAALLQELYTGEDTSPEIRQKVFDWVISAWQKELYSSFDTELISAVGESPYNGEQTELLIQLLEGKAIKEPLSMKEADIQLNLLLRTGNQSAARDWQYRFADYYRKGLVLAAIERKDYEDAKQLATAGLKGRHKDECRQWLYEIAVAQNDPVGLRNHYTHLLLTTGNMDHYEAIRDSLEEDQLKTEFSSLLHVLIQYKRTTTIAQVLLREELTEQLLTHIRNHPGFDLIMLTAPELVKKYEPEVMELLRPILLQMAGYSKQRVAAKEFGEKLKQVRKLKGGKTMVSQMLTELFEKNPGWKVLREEVEKYR